MIFIEGVESPSDPPIDWHADWLEFARRILPGEEPPDVLESGDESFDSIDAEGWINRVVEEFCMSRNEWQEYIKQQSGEEEK